MLMFGPGSEAQVQESGVFERFLDEFLQFWTILDHFPSFLAISWGSAIAGRVTTANVDNMLSADPSKCWNVLNVDWTSNCCGQHVEHFARWLLVRR